MNEREAIAATLIDARKSLEDARRVCDYLEFLRQSAVYRVETLLVLITRLESIEWHDRLDDYEQTDHKVLRDMVQPLQDDEAYSGEGVG